MPRVTTKAPATSPREPPDVRDRTFTGASASVGIQVDLAENVAFVANVTRSYRAPALEELYNFGPHIGNLVFEVGNPDLEREATVGLDLSLRHQSSRFRGSMNAYVYDIDNFVFPAVGDVEVDGLHARAVPAGKQPVRRVRGNRQRAAGWHSLGEPGARMVDAELTDTNEALPRFRRCGVR